MSRRYPGGRQKILLRIPPEVRSWLFGLGLLAAALTMVAIGEAGAAAASGKEEAGSPAAARPSAGSGLGLEAGGSAVAPANVSGAGMAVWRDEARASYSTEHFGVEMGYAGSHFDFSKVGHLPFGGRKPFDDLHRLDAGLTVKGGLWGDVGGFVGLRGSLGWERDPGDGSEGAALAGVVVPLGSRWAMTLGGGASVSKVDVQPIPIVGFRYESGGRFSADLGLPRTEIVWRGGPWWGLRLTGGIDGGYYKLANDNPVARGGYVSMLSPQAGLWFDLHPAEGLSASVGALYALPGTMTFYRESGSRIKRFDVDGAPGGGLRLRYEF